MNTIGTDGLKHLSKTLVYRASMRIGSKDYAIGLFLEKPDKRALLAALADTPDDGHLNSTSFQRSQLEECPAIGELTHPGYAISIALTVKGKQVGHLYIECLSVFTKTSQRLNPSVIIWPPHAVVDDQLSLPYLIGADWNHLVARVEALERAA